MPSITNGCKACLGWKPIAQGNDADCMPGMFPLHVVLVEGDLRFLRTLFSRWIPYFSPALSRYKYIWPFEHARVRLHDGRHQGSHPGMGNKGKPTDRGPNCTRDGIPYRSVSQLGGLAVTAEGIDAAIVRLSLYPCKAVLDVDGFQERAPSLNQANSPADFVDTDTRMLEFLTSPMDISPTTTQLPGLPTEGALPDTRITPFPLRHPESQVARPMNASTRTGHSLPLTNAATLFGDNIKHTTSVDLQQGDNVLPGAQRVSSPLDDYVNASYVQPLGTRKIYIATQGPLPATFVDFWTSVIFTYFAPVP